MLLFQVQSNSWFPRASKNFIILNKIHISNGEMIFSVSMSITTYKIQNFTSSYTLMNPINKRT